MAPRAALAQAPNHLCQTASVWQFSRPQLLLHGGRSQPRSLQLTPRPPALQSHEHRPCPRSGAARGSYLAIDCPQEIGDEAHELSLALDCV